MLVSRLRVVVTELLDALRPLCSKSLPPWTGAFAEHAAWRPAATSEGPARYCHRCERIEPLSEAEFFALFGELFGVLPMVRRETR